MLDLVFSSECDTHNNLCHLDNTGDKRLVIYMTAGRCTAKNGPISPSLVTIQITAMCLEDKIATWYALMTGCTTCLASIYCPALAHYMLEVAACIHCHACLMHTGKSSWFAEVNKLIAMSTGPDNSCSHLCCKPHCMLAIDGGPVQPILPVRL